MAHTPDAASDSTHGAGASSLGGYEYQIDVSVWLALDLVLEARLATQLVLEPASEEDLEAELTDTEPSRVVSTVSVEDYTLVVQVKSRGGDAWTPTTLRSLLQHGGKTRKPAAERLSDPRTRYLLVTNAGLNGGARNLKVRRAGSWPTKPAPDPLAKVLPDTINGRLGVIANVDQERLDQHIDRLLRESCHVPNAKIEACRKALRDEARQRVLGAGRGVWRRDDLIRRIRAFDGHLASTPEMERYVHPLNWGDLRTMMARRNAAIIIGQSGTGKTLATQKFYEEMRKEIPGLTRVLIRNGPQQLKDDATPEPVLYDVEDPWGRHDFDPLSRSWNDQLSQFFAKATSERMIIATSRLDVAQASRALGTVEPWRVNLEAEHYGPRERVRLYRSHIKTLPRALQQLAHSAQSQVLGRLATPLEIQKFFDSLRLTDPEGVVKPNNVVSGAIDRAHADAIEQTVIDQIHARDDVKAAAVLWAMLKASNRVSGPMLRRLEGELADKMPDMERGVTPLVEAFVAARNLRRGEDGSLAYYHPRVEAGVERLLKAEQPTIRKPLRQLLDSLVERTGNEQDWGLRTATRILAEVRRRDLVEPTDRTAVAVDAYLKTYISEGGRDFEKKLELAAAAGSNESNEGELARFLLSSEDSQWFDILWEAPERSEAWYQARRDDPATRPLLAEFIRTVLVYSRTHYQVSICDHLARLCADLDAAFMDAADEAVGLGVIPSDDAIVHGAIRDLDTFDARIVDKAVDELSSTEDQQRRWAEIDLDITNEVYPDAYADHLWDTEEGYTAREFLKVFVKEVRRRKGWRAVSTHRHVGTLLWDWLRLVKDDAKAERLNIDEFSAAFGLASATEYEAEVWSILCVSWQPEFAGPLRERIKDGRGTGVSDHSALQCLLNHLPGAFEEIIEELQASAQDDRIVGLALEVANLKHKAGKDEVEAEKAASTAMANLPEPYAEISHLSIESGQEPEAQLSPRACRVLKAVDSLSEDVRVFRVRHASAFPAELALDDIQWLLRESDEISHADAAISAAIKLNLSDVIEEALDHKFARVVAAAIKALGESVTLPLSPRLLAKADDRASPVRFALCALLKKRPHVDHCPPLVALAQDDWMRDGLMPNEPRPIARAAVAALEEMDDIPQDTLIQLQSVACETADRQVSVDLFKLCSRLGEPDTQQQVFEHAVGTQQASARNAAVREAAASALLYCAEDVAMDLVERIDAALLGRLYPPVAARLAIVLAARGEIGVLHEQARSLAANPDRRVLLVLVVWVLMGRDVKIANVLASLLPVDNAAVHWARGETDSEGAEAALEELGDTQVCAAVRDLIPKAPN